MPAHFLPVRTFPLGTPEEPLPSAVSLFPCRHTMCRNSQAIWARGSADSRLAGVRCRMPRWPHSRVHRRSAPHSLCSLGEVGLNFFIYEMVWDDSVDSSHHWAVFCGSGPHPPTPPGAPQSPHASPWHLTERGHLPFLVGGQDPQRTQTLPGLFLSPPSPCGGPGPQKALRKAQQPARAPGFAVRDQAGHVPETVPETAVGLHESSATVSSAPEPHGDGRPGPRGALPAPRLMPPLKTNRLDLAGRPSGRSVPPSGTRRFIRGFLKVPPRPVPPLSRRLLRPHNCRLHCLRTRFRMSAPHARPSAARR